MKRLSVLSAGLATAVLFWGLNLPVSGSFRLGPLLEPWDGLYKTARRAVPHESEDLFLQGMDAPVRVEMDARGVPHMFAENDKDATMALGYVVARDRLFEMDFIWRVATGRLSEVIGPSALSQDRYFRDIGMVHTVKTLSAHADTATSISAMSSRWYAAGANAWVEGLSDSDVPFEFRLLGFSPTRISAEHTQSLFAFMAFDLSFRSDDIAYSALRDRLGPVAYDLLYPEFSRHERYILPEGTMDPASGVRSKPSSGGPLNDLGADPALMTSMQGMAEGFREGKGSNNWAVNGNRSATGMPILAGDMHLNLSLPAIWYEVHIVTPDMNVYGVTFPSVPTIVEGITEHFAWAFTNTGADQVDRFALHLDESETSYLYDEEWRPLTSVADTIKVLGAEPVVHRVPWSHLGPVSVSGTSVLATKWVGHSDGRTLEALWHMNRASDHSSFESATRTWDYPMQNILYAGRDSIISIRSTGLLPIRGEGDAQGILDGTTSRTDWKGRVPFEELPAWTNPSQGFLSSTNQRPAGQTYPYYLGRDWGAIHRSQRINELLSGMASQSVDDLKAYQADVHAMQADYLIPVLDTLSGLSPHALSHVEILRSWDRKMTTESREATLFAILVDTLRSRVWDETVFRDVPRPSFVRMFDIRKSSTQWFDQVDTPVQETFGDVIRSTLDSLPPQEEIPEWGDVHHLTMKHITRSEALRPLWRSNLEYPGWEQTLSPARGRTATHSASWRVVVDLSTSPPTAWGVYPGGQSGNPFSRHYDAHIDTFLSFDYFELNLSRTPSAISFDDSI